MELVLKNINKSFGNKKVLNDVSFCAKSGKAFGLLGRNGAGKTTTIRILMDVFPPESGEILLDQNPIDHTKIGLGYLPEERGLYPKKKIFDQLCYFACLKGMDAKSAANAVDKWLLRLGMEEYRNKRLDTLSKGNQQKIQLITALAHDPQIVILDEPFSGLDPVNALLLKDIVREQIDCGKIVLFSSHQMNYIEEFCDDIAILHNGKVVLHGNLQQIKHSYKRDTLLVQSAQEEDIKAYFKDRYSIHNGGLLIKLENEDEKSAVMKKLTEMFEIDSIKVFEPSLNDIFVEYASDKEGADRK